jgi:hypothetical protein
LPPNRIQRLILDAAPHDPEIARRFALFGNRAAPASVLLNPGTVVRAIRANRRGRQSPTATTEPTAVVSANQLQH